MKSISFCTIKDNVYNEIHIPARASASSPYSENVIVALGVELQFFVKNKGSKRTSELPPKIRKADYPELKRLAWQIKDTTELTLGQVMSLYERNWKHIDKEKFTEAEKKFIEQLLEQRGRRDFLV